MPDTHRLAGWGGVRGVGGDGKEIFSLPYQISILVLCVRQLIELTIAD
jgi:hypothetical protein